MVKKILVADDEPDMIEMIKIRLEKGGYKVIAAFSGEECLKKAEEENPDIILLDILLPGISGFEVCKRLKENRITKDIPVIMVTAFIGKEAKEKGLEGGATYFLSKPFNPEELLSEIGNALRKPI